MNSIFVHFCSNFPAILKINDKTLGKLENQTDSLLIEINCEKELQLFVTPISNAKFLPSISFCAELVIEKGNVWTKSPQLEITKFDSNIFEVFLKPLNFLCNQNAFQPKTLNPADSIEIVQTNKNFNLIEIRFKQNTFFYELPEKLQNIDCSVFEKGNTYFLNIFGKTQQNQDFLAVFENFFCKFEIVADVIEKSQTQILALTYAHDIAKHGIVKKFELQQNNFVFKEEYVVLLEDKPKLPENETLVPLAFVEAINLEDFKLARSFLDSNLNNVLDDSSLKSFFGNFEEFKWNKHKNQKNCICFVFDGSPKTVKNFEFELTNGKISNITEIP